MNGDKMKRVVIVSGPSCVGKTPLLKALKKNHPEIPFGQFILYSSRQPRRGEKDGVDFYFRTEREIRSLPADRFIISPVRHLWQAIDLQEVKSVFEHFNLIVVEIYPTLARRFQEHPTVQKLAAEFETRTVFISPVTDEEIAAVQQGMGFSSPQQTLAAIMTPKLISRSLQQGKLMTPAELEDIRIRASRAYEEIEMGRLYTDFIVNHDGEDSQNWKYSPPLGEAGQTLKRLVGIIIHNN